MKILIGKNSNGLLSEIIISLALSLSLISILLFYLLLSGFEITETRTYIIIAALNIVSATIYLSKLLMKRW